MAHCLISFGANIGNPREAILSASEMLRHHLVAAGGSYQLSRLFRTPPIGGPAGQPPFINAVAALQTQFSAVQVWNTIRTVEQELGRQRDRRWEARRIDLDILLYDNLRIWTPHLKIPHPRMCMRRFILIPTLDVAPEWIDPVSEWSIAQLAGSLQSGPGSLILVSQDVDRHSAWLSEIAEKSMAQIVPWGDSPLSDQSRWICLASVREMQRREDLAASQPLQQAKLTTFLTSDAVDGGAIAQASDWETRHQSWAASLRFSDSQSPSPVGCKAPFQLAGPRYLLASEDSQWAIHEVVSALEAMDCPVEPCV